MTALSGQVAWITGAGSGIGRATALRLAAEGALTILTGRRVEPLVEVAGILRDEGGEAETLPVDVCDICAIRAAGDHIRRRHGTIDIYVGAAGFNIPQRTFATLSLEAADEILRANLNGAFHASSIALDLMRSQGRGLLIHISSWSGKRISLLSGPAYTAAKAGVVALSESINLEVAKYGIRSTVISPGGVNTSLLNQFPNDLPPEVRSRLLTPEDCADMIFYVAALPPHIRVDEIMITPTIQGT